MDASVFRLEVEPLDLGEDVKAIGLELLDPENREPVRGADAARTWSTVLWALAGTEPWALDFFSHLDCVRVFCRRHQILFREAAHRCMVIAAPETPQLAALFEPRVARSATGGHRKRPGCLA